MAPYIYTPNDTENCTCDQSRPVSHATKKHPFGSIWRCSNCGAQWVKEKAADKPDGSNSGVWRKLESNEMLILTKEKVWIFLER